MKMHVFVSFEGNDAAGKTTHAKKLLERLENAGIRACYVKSPDVLSVFYKKIYSTLESGWALRHPILFQGMQFLNKLHFQHFQLPRLRQEMDVIIMDRWDLSMRAYGLATGVPGWVIRLTSGMLSKPDQVFLLSGNPTLREEPRDIYEKDNSLQKMVSEFYNSRSWRSEYEEVVDIIVSDDPEETFKQILKEFRF